MCVKDLCPFPYLLSAWSVSEFRLNESNSRTKVSVAQRQGQRCTLYVSRVNVNVM